MLGGITGPTASRSRSSMPNVACWGISGRAGSMAGTSLIGESRGGMSPPCAPRTVREPLASHGSRCSAVERHQRLCLSHRAPPVAGWLRASAEQRGPFGPAPLQNLHPYYEPLRPSCSASVLWSLRIQPLGRLPWHRDDGFPRSVQKPGPASRRLHAGCRSGSLQATPELIPEEWLAHGSDIV